MKALIAIAALAAGPALGFDRAACEAWRDAAQAHIALIQAAQRAALAVELAEFVSGDAPKAVRAEIDALAEAATMDALRPALDAYGRVCLGE